MRLPDPRPESVGPSLLAPYRVQILIEHFLPLLLRRVAILLF